MSAYRYLLTTILAFAAALMISTLALARSAELGPSEDISNQAWQYYRDPGFAGIVERLAEPREPEERLALTYALGIYYSSDGEGTRELVNLLKDQDHDIRMAAVWILGDPGTCPVEQLRPLLKHDRREVRWAAALTLGYAGVYDKAAVAVLTDIIEEQEPLRSRGLEALGAIGPEAEEAVPAIAALLERTAPESDVYSDRTTKACLEALGRLGPAGIDVLLTQLDHPDHYVRETVFSALGGYIAEYAPYLNPETGAVAPAISGNQREYASARRIEREIVPMLIKRLGVEEIEEAGAELARAVAQAGPSIRPALIEAIRGEDETMRYGALYALAWLGSEAKPAAPLLFSIVESGSARDAEVAGQILANLSWSDEDIFFRLMGLLEHESADARLAALNAVGDYLKLVLDYGMEEELIEPLKPQIIEELTRLLDDPDGFVSNEALLLFQDIDGQNPLLGKRYARMVLDDPEGDTYAPFNWLYNMGSAGVPGLLLCLGSDSPAVLQKAAAVLGDLGPDAAEAVPELVKLVGAEDSLVRQKAAYALGMIGAYPELAIPVLENAMQTGDYALRVAAVKAVGRFGEPARRAVPELVKLLDSDDLGLVPAALEALATIGPAAQDAVPKLEAMTNDPDFGPLAELALKYILPEDDVAEE